MRTMMLTLALTALAAGPAGASECATQPELPPGTAMSDGTINGERQAFAYLKEKEPALHAGLSKLPREELRRRYARQLSWFQQVGNCRTRQKEESIRQLRAELEAAELAAEHRRADEPRKAALEKRLRAALEERFDSDLALLDHQAASLEQALEEYAREAKAIRAKLVARKKAREHIIEKRLGELLKAP